MKKTSGFIALITVIIMVVILSLVGLVLALASVQQGIGSQANANKYVLDQGISACLDKALLQLAFDDTNTSTGSINTPLSNNRTLSCSIDSITANTPNWLITVTASVSNQIHTAKRTYTISQENLSVVAQTELSN